jgi:hypothetical protein
MRFVSIPLSSAMMKNEMNISLSSVFAMEGMEGRNKEVVPGDGTHC